jgi:hypothetical protein
MLIFDPIHHVYTLEGRRIPNVTSIMTPIVDYSRIPAQVLEAAADRGNYVHKMCEMYLWETLEEDGLPDMYKPYLEAFKKFMAETGFIAEQIEERVYHKSLFYAGTLDLGGILPGRGRGGDKRALIDIKTTFKLMASVGPQTAAYADAWASHRPKSEHFEERYGLQLKKDGSYKLQPFKSVNDSNIFRSCLAIYNFMQQEQAA